MGDLSELGLNFDELGEEGAIAGDGSAAAGGDGALRFAFHAFVRVGFVDAGVVRCLPIVGALGWSGGAVLWATVITCPRTQTAGRMASKIV